MAITKTRNLAPMTVAANSTTAVFIPAGEWEYTDGVTGARAWGESRGRNGAIQAQPAVQVANDVRNAGTATGVGPVMSTDNVYDPSAAAAIANSTTSRYMRPGWLVSLTTGGTLATMTVMGVVELQY